MIRCFKQHYLVFTIILSLQIQIFGYEKTLRKIVRDHSKMVHRPFSDSSSQILWKNSSFKINEHDAFPAYIQMNAMLHKKIRPKISTILSGVESGRSKSGTRMNIGKSESLFHNDVRQARNTLYNKTLPQPSVNNTPDQKNESNLDKSASKFFPSIEEHETSNEKNGIQSNDIANTIIIPENVQYHNETEFLVQKIFVHKLDTDVSPGLTADANVPFNTEMDADTDRDFLIERIPIKSSYIYNATTNPYVCHLVRETNTDIDAQQKFLEFEIEPKWMTKKTYWNHIFESRYESLMRNPKWPSLKVILVPRTHVDTIWKKTFKQYFDDSVNKIISNIVKKLQFYSNLTFAWNEISHLSRWWMTTSHKSRSAFRKLVKSGRLEITTGGWVETDEATTHLFGLLHQFIEGHQWLKYHLNYSPKVGWMTNTVTHSPTFPYILSASDISQIVITNLHYAWEQYFAEYQISNFVWQQNWDTDKNTGSPLNDALFKMGNEKYGKNSVLTHYLPFNSAGFKACGPNKAICENEFNFANVNKNIDINPYNVKEKAELLLEQYSKTGTLTSHNVIIAPLGGYFRYESQTEFDYQYNNYQKLADFVNYNREIYKATIVFGTPKDYFRSIFKEVHSFPSLQGDFLNFADLSSGSPAYWTGFYTTRPYTKILLRRLQSTLRTTEMLFSFAVNLNVFREYDTSNIIERLIKARENVARLMDRNIQTGTLTANKIKYVHHLILTTVKDCWFIQEISVSFLSTKSGETKSYLQKYVFRDGEFMSIFKTVSPGDQIYIFNSMNHERTEIVELLTRYSTIRVVDHSKKDVTIQINPVWKYSSENVIRISKRFFKIVFAVIVPPMTLELFQIKETYDGTLNAAVLYCSACVVENIPSEPTIFPFSVQPLQTGDIQLENHKQRLTFDEITGFLKTVFEKETNIEKNIILDYGAFRGSNLNSGMFLFNTNVSKPLHDVLMPYRIGIKKKIVLIITGQITTELNSIFGRFLAHKTKIFNLVGSALSKAMYVESKIDYDVSPNNRELELFLTIQTDISNGNPPQIFTDNNGFQYTARALNISRRVESNMYPMTSLAYLQDRRSRLTVVTDHAQGVTALQEGQLVIMLDRRVLFDDGRGTNEGLADNSATYQRHFVILEGLNDAPYNQPPNVKLLNLPSSTALYLSNSLNNVLDLFFIDKNNTYLSYYGFLPLIKTSFPCDVTVINYRVILHPSVSQHHTINTALLTLHRQSSSCRIENIAPSNCNGDSRFSVDKILRNVKAVYKTNLVGTSEGMPLLHYTLANFLPMELVTLRIYF
ncbi:alpha-mannosidase 2 [Bombyx mori]